MARVAVLVDLGFFLHHELVCMRKVALRLGELSDRRQWLFRDNITRRLLKGEIKVQDLNEDDVTYDATQKGVDIKFGIDIASLAFKRLVEKVVLKASIPGNAVTTARAEASKIRSTLDAASRY